jgi:hypothetical protein
VQQSPRLPHQVLLAKQLVTVGASREAQTLLEQALREHERSPRYVRRNNRPWARQAKRLLQSLAESSAA